MFRGMLSSYRVLDLADQQGMFCGYILAALGAEVIAVEPPGGSPARALAPVAGGGNGPEGSLWWQAYGRGKSSLELDLGSDSDGARLRDLAADADFLIESFPSADARRLGLGYETLAAVNPGLICVSVSPFGRTGPKAGWPATDLTVWASSGAHILAGDDDRAPVRTSVPQSFLHAGADAACAALIALEARHRTGLGQQVDVSAQQSSAQGALGMILAAPNNGGFALRRIAGGLRGTFPIRFSFPCRDGHVTITLMFGHAFEEPNRRLLRWLHECGALSVAHVAKDWNAEARAIEAGERPVDGYLELCARIEAFTLARTRQELFREGLARGVYIAPAFDIPGLLEEPHFRARGFWDTLDFCDCDPVRVPGAFAKFSAAPLKSPAPAPRLGNAGRNRGGSGQESGETHRRSGAGGHPRRGVTRAGGAAEVEGGLRGASKQGPTALAQQNAREPVRQSDDPLTAALSGLKVLDFMWVIAGPLFTRMLADYGATVIKVESGERLDPVRGSAPLKDGRPGMETSALFASFNAGKLGVTVDPGHPAGREVILDLVRWADVVTESFSPKAMKAWNLDYPALRRVNPSIIMLSSCLMGQSGPRSSVPGYGNMASALAGFHDLTGWPDRSPAGPFLAYTDTISPRIMAVSLLAALEHRRTTGAGQYVDVAQAEAAIHLLAPAILDYEVNGNIWRRMGNRDLQLCPHGVYPARGTDRWVAIACQSDAAWRSLCEVMGLDGAAQDPDLATAVGRRQRADELDRLLSGWTRSRDEQEVESAMIAAGVAAHVVQNSAECAADPQLRHRDHFRSVPHATVGELVVEASRFQLSRTPARSGRAGPQLGEHNFRVLEEILGYDPQRIADVLASGAMG